MSRIQDSGFGIQEEKQETTVVGKAGDTKIPESRIPNPESLEIGGRNGPDPTRYGDWELKGRCVDF